MKKSFKIKSKRTNWSLVLNSLVESYKEFLNLEFCNASPSEEYDKFLNIITSTITTHTKKPKKLQFKKHNPVIWWDSECDRVPRLRKAAFKKWDFSKKLEDYITYKKQIAVARKTFKRKKKESFQAFCKTLNFKTNQSYVWNTVKILKNKWTNISSCNLSNSDEKQIEALEKIAPSWVPSDPDWIPKCQINDFLNKPFQFTEFNTALDSRKSKSSPGIDGIDYDILHFLPINCKLILIDIFNEIYKSHDYPVNRKKTIYAFH